MIEVHLVEHLSEFGAAMYPGAAPLEYETPCVIYNRISTAAEDDLDGFTGVGWVSFQIDVYDKEHLAAKELARDIRDKMLAWDDEVVSSVSWTEEADITDTTTSTTLYRTMMTFRMFVTL